MHLDLLLLIFVLSFGVFGFIKGFAWQIFSLGIVLGIIFGAEPFTAWLTHRFEPTWPRFVLWGFCAFGIVIVGWILRYSTLRFVQRTPLNALNRWLGFFVGATKGFVIILFFGTVLHVLPEKTWQRFGTAKSELGQSQMFKASSDLMKWEGLAIMTQLRQLQDNMAFDWKIQTTDPRHPWNWPSHVDSN
jgi:uncharacterized membrane protein required for colicin V production